MRGGAKIFCQTEICIKSKLTPPRFPSFGGGCEKSNCVMDVHVRVRDSRIGVAPGL